MKPEESYKFSLEHLNIASFGQITDKYETKINSWYFSSYRILRGFWAQDLENSKKSDLNPAKDPKKVEISKIYFLQSFRFMFFYNLVENGHFEYYGEKLEAVEAWQGGPGVWRRLIYLCQACAPTLT